MYECYYHSMDGEGNKHIWMTDHEWDGRIGRAWAFYIRSVWMTTSITIPLQTLV